MGRAVKLMTVCDFNFYRIIAYENGGSRNFQFCCTIFCPYLIQGCERGSSVGRPSALAVASSLSSADKNIAGVKAADSKLSLAIIAEASCIASPARKW